MKTEINFVLPDGAQALGGYRPTKQRHNMTYDATMHAQAEQMAKDLGFDLITLLRACFSACLSSYQYDPAPFRREAARAKARAAEAALLRARDAQREAERLASPEADKADGYAPVSVDDIPEI